MKTSAISKFYEMPIEERLIKVKEFAGLTDEDIGILKKCYFPEGEKMIENCIGYIEIPIGIAPYFKINDKDYLVPMATEESSVVAAASNGAKIARKSGGFKAICSGSLMKGQIQFVGHLEEFEDAKRWIEEDKEYLLDVANSITNMSKYGGGVRDISIRKVSTQKGDMYIVEIEVDTGDAMGANAVNTICEEIAPCLKQFVGGKPNLRTVSNLCDKRVAKAETKIKINDLAMCGFSGKEVAERIEWASIFAEYDIYRAATHNKGIMNGVSAVALATGNDTRALEAGAHAYANRTGKYMPLSKWKIDESYLKGDLEMPMAVGTVGGAIKYHPTARVSMKILSVEHASELAEVMAAVGLSNNLAAISALATEGIQKSHMKLHQRKFSK